MNKGESGPQIGRRELFGTVAVGVVGAAAAMTPGVAAAQAAPLKPAVAAPGAAATAAESAPPEQPMVTVGKTGSDVMVDVIKSLDIGYVSVMPGSTFRALHESIINYGGNTKPELITCLHEEIAVSMAHGYAKVAGKPMLTFLHGVVGLQHGSMAIYNAWADRVPVLAVVGNTLNAVERRPGVEWTHSAQDNAALVRDFTKWDDMPVSLTHFAESMVRAHEIATTPPCAPTVIVADAELAERPIGDDQLAIPPVARAFPPAGDPSAVAAAAALLAGAQFPVIVADRLVRSQRGLEMLVELAETLGAPVIDLGARMNMPSQHPLNLTWSAQRILAQADVVLGLEVVDLFGTLNTYLDRVERESAPIPRRGSKIISIGSALLLTRPNFQDFQRYQPVDLDIAADGEQALPSLLAALRQGKLDPAKVAARTAQIKDAWAKMHQRVREQAAYGWDASPISVPRLCADLYSLIKDDDWALVTPHQFQMHWQTKLWNFTRCYQHIGTSGGNGVGYQAGAALGAAIAHREAGGRLPVAILGDGDLMCTPGALWTAAHHQVPLLMIVHNNRAYHQEVMHIQVMSDRHARGIGNAHIGTRITSPDIDFATLAKSMGVWGEGPIARPDDLVPALQRALAVVRGGKPALVDVVSQPR